jgi:hypothetical protein
MGYSLGDISANLPFYSKVGGFAGSIIASVYLAVASSVVLQSHTEVIILGGFAILIAWLSALVLFGIWLKFTIPKILVQTSIVVLLTGAILIPIFDWWSSGFEILLGLLIGIAVGLILTTLCKSITQKGMR